MPDATHPVILIEGDGPIPDGVGDELPAVRVISLPGSFSIAWKVGSPPGPSVRW
jgi:hypothetical protein